MAEAWRELIELPLCVTFLAAAWQGTGLRSFMKLTLIKEDFAWCSLDAEYALLRDSNVYLTDLVEISSNYSLKLRGSI